MNNIIIHKDLSDRILGLSLTVHCTLGPGLLESAYQSALCWELAHAGIKFEQQKEYPLQYKGDRVCSYFADLVVE